MKKKATKILSAVLAILVLVTMFAGVIGTVTVKAAPSVPQDANSKVEETIPKKENVSIPDQALLQEETTKEEVTSSVQVDNSIVGLPNSNKDDNTASSDETVTLPTNNKPLHEGEKDNTENNAEDKNTKDDNTVVGTDPNAVSVKLQLLNLKSTQTDAIVYVTIKNKTTKDKVTCEFRESESFSIEAPLAPGEYKILSVESMDYETIKMETKSFKIEEDQSEPISIKVKKSVIKEGFFKSFIKNNSIFIVLLIFFSVGLFVIKKRREDNLTKI
jgi:hypothetical protein